MDGTRTIRYRVLIGAARSEAVDDVRASRSATVEGLGTPAPPSGTHVTHEVLSPQPERPVSVSLEPLPSRYTEGARHVYFFRQATRAAPFSARTFNPAGFMLGHQPRSPTRFV